MENKSERYIFDCEYCCRYRQYHDDRNQHYRYGNQHPADLQKR